MPQNWSLRFGTSLVFGSWCLAFSSRCLELSFVSQRFHRIDHLRLPRRSGAKTGEELWKSKVGSGIVGQPVTYKGPDGKQYVAILAGVGGWSGAIVAGGLDPRDATAALGFANALPDLPQATTSGGMLYIFGLP